MVGSPACEKESETQVEEHHFSHETQWNDDAVVGPWMVLATNCKWFGDHVFLAISKLVTPSVIRKWMEIYGSYYTLKNKSFVSVFTNAKVNGQAVVHGHYVYNLS